MTEPKVARFYLHKPLKQRAESGNHNFINKLTEVLTEAGFRVAFHNDTMAEQLKGANRPGYSIVLMNEPLNKRGLTMRLNYFYPFWHLETRAKRWEWPVAQAAFNATQIPAGRARIFTRTWKERLFEQPDAAATCDGYVYVPLQGKLLTHRSFQSCSPLEMLDQLLEHEPDRQIRTTLHPKEDYTQPELDGLEALTRKHPRLSLENRPMEDLLRGCDYVATQNSSVALMGYFWHKPAVLFGQIDFHHIAANVPRLGAKQAIHMAPQMTPDFDAYLWWFLQEQSINAGRPEATQNIRTTLQRCGWPI